MTPAAVQGLSAAATDIDAGTNHTCVIIPGGGMECWGSNVRGEIGDGTEGTNRTTAVPVTVVGGPVEAIGLGNGTTCARLET